MSKHVILDGSAWTILYCKCQAYPAWATSEIESLQQQLYVLKEGYAINTRERDSLKATLEGVRSENVSLQQQVERAFQMLEMYGVPRKRAKEIANGIDVLGTRFRKESNILNHEISDLEGERDRILGLLNIAICPNTSCVDGAIQRGPDPDGNWEAEQCQWCDEKEQALVNEQPTTNKER